MKPKIFITGCAKTGTTLLRRLMEAYTLCVHPHEISVEDFTHRIRDTDIAKRWYQAVLSNCIPPEECERQLDILKRFDIYIINVTRNRVDTLKSTNGWVKPARYVCCMDQAERYKDSIAVTVKYERLIKSPLTVQEEIEKAIPGLKEYRKYTFTEYPDYVDSSKETHLEGNYKLRKLGEEY